MDDNSTSSGSLYESTSSFEEDDDLDEILIAHIMNEYEEIFLCKTPQRTSMLSGAQFDTRLVTVEEAVAMSLLIVGHNDCIGTIDGTHISAWVSQTTNDAHVFLDALTRLEVNFPWPSEGKYYVVDSGYPCISGFLPPYRGEEYEVEDLSVQGEEESTSIINHSIDLSYESATVMEACRDQIAQVMWANYI
ncbi:hypothetical protein AAG906_021021 [Vitis piasezkii]